MANYLIDVDGTICDDIPNEESHRYKDAIPFENAANYLQQLAEEGHTITYFTSREEKDREVTLAWLNTHNFPVHGLIMNKPRGGGKEYIWVDNTLIHAVHYNNVKWDDLFLEFISNL